MAIKPVFTTKQTLAALQFALTRDFKYLITSDDDFLLKMDVISKIDDNWFNLGILSAVQRLQVKVDGLNDQNWAIETCG